MERTNWNNKISTMITAHRRHPLGVGSRGQVAASPLAARPPLFASAAPPVYRPVSRPEAVQGKPAGMAPPVYRPVSRPEAVQGKPAGMAPPVYRPVSRPEVAQGKPAGMAPPVYRPAEVTGQPIPKFAVHSGTASRVEQKSSVRVVQQKLGRHQRSLTASSVVQRFIIFDKDALGSDVYTTGYDDGDQESLDQFISKVVTKRPDLLKRQDEIRKILEPYVSDKADFVYNTVEEAIQWLNSNGFSTSSSSKQEEEDAFSDTEEQVEGQTVGKITFPGQTYHSSIKPKIIHTIGVKVLSMLVYKDNKHHNFNFWIEKNGDIFADQNSTRNSKGLFTGYYLTEQQNVAKRT